MNRIHYLKQTIDININLIKKFNEDNDNKFELSLCNYDSKDGLDNYIKKNYQEHIDSGLLVYTRVINKKYFERSHAKNIAHKYSTGDVLINLDSDNFLNYNVIQYFNDFFTNNNIDSVVLCDKKNFGLIGLSRNNFYKLGGYNEKMIVYGFEDIDLVNRLKKYLYCKKHYLPPPYEYNDKCTIYQSDLIKIENSPKIIDDNVYNSLSDYIQYNEKIMSYYDEKNIMNPNEFENIIFGDIN